VVIELWAVKAFCLTPVIACLFFVAGVVYIGDAIVGDMKDNGLPLMLFSSYSTILSVAHNIER
jgi:hypothetical protein